MGTQTVPAPVDGFKFQKNVSLLNGAASLGFNVSSQLQADVALALASDAQPFPVRDIDIAEVGLKAETAKPIEFARGQDKISFTASGGGFAGLGVYRTGAALLGKLGDGAKDFSLSGIEFGVDASSLLSVLRWGYSASGKVNGAMALGSVGTATLTVAGDTEGLFAVVRRLPTETHARTVVQLTADSWMLPRQVVSIDQVEPGTWIMAEVMGGISAKLGAQVGYDFNWVREARLGGLTGDIGLRLQLGVNAAIGFSASGRCAVVVSRESDAKTLRLRLFKLKTRELDLSLDAAASIQAVDKLLPDKIDDFIAAVFDTHGQQILGDLKILEKWTDPKTPISKLLADGAVGGAEKLIAHLAGITPDQLQQEFDKVHSTAVGFITKWHELPNKVSSTILKLVESQVDLAPVRSIAQQLATSTTDTLKTLLNTELNRVDFFQTPTGKLLEAIAGEGVLALPAKPIAEVQDIAKKIIGVLDGSTIEEVLKKFQSFVETELHLDKVMKVVGDTDFANLDALLKNKLAAFLGQDNIVVADLDKIRKTVGLLLAKRDEYYQKALAALHRKYTFELTATYQSTTTDQALLDASFDFAQDDGTVSAFFQQAVRGQLDDLFSKPHPRIKIGTGKITHGIKRQSQVDVTLPFLKATESHLNESLASVDAAAMDGGLLFTLNSSDTVASNQRKSVLSLTMSLARVRPDVSNVQVHSDSIAINYSMLYAKQNMKLSHLKAQVGPAVKTFFAEKIPDLQTLLTFIDQRAEEAIPNGPNLLGNGLISLQVSLPSAAAIAAGRAWLGLPADPQDATYNLLSVGIQNSLKRNIHDCVFVEPEKYSNISTASVVLAYCALVPRVPPNRGRGLPFWDFENPAERRLTLNHPQTVKNLAALLERAQQLLEGDSDAQFFRPDDAARILGNIDANSPLLHSLLFSEAEVINHAFEGGVKIGQFMKANATPTEAVAALAEFGSKLTEAFNSDVSTLLGPGLRALGTRVFLDAARSVDSAGGADLQETNAMLNIEFLKANAKFDAAALIAAGHVDPAQLALADRVVSLG